MNKDSMERIIKSFNHMIASMDKFKSDIIDEGGKTFLEGDQEGIANLMKLMVAIDDIKRKTDKTSTIITEMSSALHKQGKDKENNKKQDKRKRKYAREIKKTSDKEKLKLKKVKLGDNVNYEETVEFVDKNSDISEIKLNDQTISYPILVSIQGENFIKASCKIVEGKKAILLKGSIISEVENSKINQACLKRRHTMIENKQLIPNERGMGLLVTEDIVFDNPTIAASVVLGKTVHYGDKIWKGINGYDLETLLGTNIR